MADNVEVLINSGPNFTGRLIGIIDDEEYRAINNTKDAARRIFTASSVGLEDVGNPIGKMFVIATNNFPEHKLARIIFISPKIRFMTFKFGQKTWRADDDNDYTLRRL